MRASPGLLASASCCLIRLTGGSARARLRTRASGTRLDGEKLQDVSVFLREFVNISFPFTNGNSPVREIHPTSQRFRVVISGCVRFSFKPIVAERPTIRHADAGHSRLA